MVYIFFDKKSFGCAVASADKSTNKSIIIPEHQLPKKLGKFIIRIFGKQKVHSFFLRCCYCRYGVIKKI